MKTIQISAEKRSELGKKSTRDLRKSDHVPCVMYGGAEVLHFHAHENDFRHIVYTPEVFIVEIKINGGVHKAVMQELQFHPVTDKLNHIDFVEVFDDKPVTVELPINLVGAAIGLKDGGKPRQRRRVLKVRGLINNLPDTLDIDITDVAVGDVIKIGDLSYENLEILDPARSMIFAIVSSRVSMKGMELVEPEAEEEVAEGEEGVEGEEGAEAPDAEGRAPAEEGREG
ncbi:MAG: 50S ribosomal protein L25 [Bacteroidales bacterium]|nr:50S ribosomal protein L25 [Bacteroidales bacterium]